MFNVKKTKTSLKKAVLKKAVCGTLTVMMAFTSIPLTSFAAGATKNVTLNLLSITESTPIVDKTYDGQEMPLPTWGGGNI